MADEKIAKEVLEHFGINLDEDVIEHYGRKGMKWGVVHDRGPDGRVKITKTVSEDHKVSRELKAKPRSEMSNAELKRLNERLQLEKTNNELQSRTALQKIKTGTAIAGTILAAAGTINTAIQFTRSPAGQAVIAGVKKAFEASK
jgi:hypothetical protein